MVNRIPIYSIQLLLFVLQIATKPLEPDNSVKITNTENIILSLGSVNGDTRDDLEVIKNYLENPRLEKKLHNFHKYINLMEVTERPKERYYLRPHNEMKYFRPAVEMFYPDSPYGVATNENFLEKSERRKKKKIWKNKNIGKIKSKGRFLRKRQLFSPPDIEDSEAEQNYMEKEYWDYVDQCKKNNTAFNYTNEGKPEETLKDIIIKITDIKTPKNCTNFTGIGIQAVECILKNYEAGQIDKKEMNNKICKILFVWFFIYFILALFLFCSKGWGCCCCCCPCEFCFPDKIVREIQKYIEQNPPGVYTNPNGVEENYTPTQKENELYERLRRLIADF